MHIHEHSQRQPGLLCDEGGFDCAAGFLLANFQALQRLKLLTVRIANLRVTLRRMAASAASGAEMLQGRQSGSSKVKVLWKQWRWLWSSFVRCCQVSPFPVYCIIYNSRFCIFSYYGFASDQHSGKGHAGILSKDPVYTTQRSQLITVIFKKHEEAHYAIIQTTIELSINQSVANQYDKTTKCPVHHFQQLFESPSCSMLPDCLQP